MPRLFSLRRPFSDLIPQATVASSLGAAVCATLFAAAPLAAGGPAGEQGADPGLRAQLIADAKTRSAQSTAQLQVQPAADRPWSFDLSPSLTGQLDEHGLGLEGWKDGEAWGLGLQLVSFGRRGALVPAQPRLLRSVEHHAELDHGGLREWVVGGRGGLTHGFLVERPPHRPTDGGGVEAGSGDLLLELALSGGFIAERSMDGQAVILRRGAAAVVYGDVTAVDAHDRRLETRLAATDGGLQLRVDAFGAAYPLRMAVQVSELAKLLPPDSLGIELAAWSVDISGDTAVVSQYLGDSGIYANAGKVFLYQRNEGGPGNWGFVATIVAPDGRTSDHFGYSVAIDGDTLVVGAYAADEESPLIIDSGLVYVFGRDVGGPGAWGHVKTLSNPTAAAVDWFGWAVDIDGDTLVTSANAADRPPLFDVGEAFIFERNEGGADNWGLVQTLVSPVDQGSSFFARDVAISGDTVVVGSRFTDVDTIDDGAAYIFERDLGGADNWGLAQSLDADDGALADYFGYDVAIDGDVVVVGAYLADAPALDSGAAYVFERDAGGAGAWGQTRKLTASDGAVADYFGWSTAVEGDAILIGSYLDDSPLFDAGSAYLFRRDEGGAGLWGETEAFTAADATAGAHFGTSLAIDGGSFLVGAELASLTGAAYVFELAAQADLAISLADAPDPVAPGGAVTYTVTVSNNGPDEASNIVVSAIFGPDAGVGSTTSGCAEDPNGAGACSLGSLGAGQSAVYTVTRPVDGGASGTLTFETTVTADTADPNALDNAATANTTVSGGGGSADISLLKTDSADPVAPGATLVYSLEVLNNGPDPALDVQLVDTLPAGVSGAVTTGCAESPGGVDGCSLGTIDAGTSKTVTVSVTVDAAAGSTLDNTATVSSSTGDPNVANNTASESTNVGAGSADLVISMDDDVDPLTAGGLLTYTVEVANLAGDSAPDVVVATTLPASVTSPSTVGCAEDPNGFAACSLGTIDPGSITSFTISVMTDAGVFDTLIAEASVSSSASDPNPANNSTTESTAVAAAGEADLWILQRDSADPLDAGAQLTYTFWVGNRGPVTAEGVVLSNILPTELVDLTVTGCETGTLPSCGLGSLASGAIKVVSVTGTIIDTATGGTLSNEATVSSANPDPNTADNTALETTTIIGAPGTAELAVSIEESLDPVAAGSSVVYTVQVVNLGPNEATAVTVSSTLSSGLALATTAGCAEDPAGAAACSLGSLVPGLPVSFTITVPVDLAAAGAVTIMSTVSSATADSDTSNNSDTENTAIQASSLADLAVSFTAADATAAPGGTATYQVTVSNSGPDDATGVQVTTALSGIAATAVTTGCAEDPSGSATCTLGALAAGDSASFTIDLPVPAGATGSFQLDVTASSDVPDPATADNSASQTTEIDATPPTVTAVSSVGDTGDGSLDFCEEAQVRITELLVTFSEAMDATLATDVASYRLIAAGPDRDVDTRQCDTLAGDDTVFALAGVTYDAGSETARLDVGALPDGPYRLLVCDALTDAAGNALDGDEDATAGVDFRRYFRVDTGNLFREGHFDCNLDQWARVSTVDNEISYTAFDVDGASISGGAVFYNNLSTTQYSLGQCVPVTAVGNYSFGASVWLRDLESTLTVSRTCELYAQADCSGAVLGQDSQSDAFTTTTGTWQALPGWTFNAAAGTQSALCSVDLELADPGAEITVLVDDVIVTGRILVDGFETGDTSRWSTTVN